MEKVIRFVKSSYFSLPGVAWILLISFAVYVLVGTACFPKYLLIEYFGPLGHLSKFLQEKNLSTSVPLLIAFLALTCHLCEAIYCWQLCREKKIEETTRVKWILSTMCFGGFSLYELVRYQPPVAQE